MARWRLRLLDSGPGTPAMNMAIDEAILRGAEARPTLRLYAWDPPAISLGYFQPASAAPAGPHPVVRRLTGGGAILHEDELTYALAAPAAFFGAGLKEGYRRVHGAIADALARVGIACDPPASEPLRAGNAGEPFFCSERRSAYDLRAGGRKLVGSAQRRVGRAVLQHGSVPLAPLREASGNRPIGYEELGRAIAAAFAAHFDADLVPETLALEERAAARAIATERYEAEAWTALR